MIYARPDPLAADASWQGAAAYTRPDPLAADASFSAPSTGVTAYASALPALGAPEVIARSAQIIAAVVATETPLRTPAVFALTAAAFVAAPAPLGAPAVRGFRGYRNRLVKNLRHQDAVVVGYANTPEAQVSTESEPSPPSEFALNLNQTTHLSGVTRHEEDGWVWEYREGEGWVVWSQG